MSNTCRECKEDTIVVDYSEGTYVCTNCGLVHEDHIMMANVIISDDEESNTPIPPCVWKEANMLFEKIQNENMYRGKIKKAVFCNCLLQICEQFNIYRSVKEISEMMDIDQSIINKTRKYIDDSSPSLSFTDNLIQLIPRYLNKISNSSVTTKIQLKKLCLNPSLLEGKTPHTKLVTFMYYIVGDTYSKKELCSIYDISIVTLNKAYKQFIDDIYKVNLENK